MVASQAGILGACLTMATEPSMGKEKKKRDKNSLQSPIPRLWERFLSHLGRSLASWLTPFDPPRAGVEEGMERHLGCLELAGRAKRWRMGEGTLGNGSTAQIAELIFTKGPQHLGVVAPWPLSILAAKSALNPYFPNTNWPTEDFCMP